MAEYIEREAVLELHEGVWFSKGRYTKMIGADTIKKIPAADVIHVPLKYAAMTNIHDGKEYTLDLSIPITKKQFDAIANGTDIWEVLKNG